jgi:hypothetical protein
MLKKPEIVTIYHKPGLSYFQMKNKQVLDSLFGGVTVKVGKYVSAVNEMTARHTLNTMLLRNLLGTNPDTVNSNWDELVRTWWSTINISVPAMGYKLQVGLSYDVNDPVRNKYISKLKGVETDEDLARVVESTIPLTDRFMYGTPLDILEYLQYLYVLIHREVANSIDDIDKSTNIRLYLHTEAAAKKIEEDQAKLHVEVSKLFVSVSEDSKKVKQILRAYNLLDNVLPVEITDHNNNVMRLSKIVSGTPKVFKMIMSDKLLAKKAFIGELLDKNIISRLPGSDTIVLSTDNNIILGTSVDSVLSYFEEPSNKDIVSTTINQLSAANKNLVTE